MRAIRSDGPAASSSAQAASGNGEEIGMLVGVSLISGWMSMARRFCAEPSLLFDSRSDGPAEFRGDRLKFFAACHQVLQAVEVDLVLGERAERLAAVQHGEAVADRIGVADIVGDEDDAEARCCAPGRCISAPSRSAPRRAPRSARRGSAPWRRNRPRGRSPRIWRSPPDSVPTACCGSRTSMPIFFISSRVTRSANVACPCSGNGPESFQRLAAHEEVPRDRHQRDHREILEDRRDAGIERVARVC